MSHTFAPCSSERAVTDRHYATRSTDTDTDMEGSTRVRQPSSRARRACPGREPTPRQVRAGPPAARPVARLRATDATTRTRRHFRAGGPVPLRILTPGARRARRETVTLSSHWGPVASRSDRPCHDGSNDGCDDGGSTERRGRPLTRTRRNTDISVGTRRTRSSAYGCVHFRRPGVMRIRVELVPAERSDRRTACRLTRRARPAATRTRPC